MDGRIWGTLSILFLFLAALSVSAQQPSAASTQSNWVVLRNGATFQGVVVDDAESISIYSDTGETKLPKNSVLKVCKNAEEAYQLLQKTIIRDTVPERLKLARWCLSAGLMEHARKEGEIACSMDSRSLDAKLFLKQMNQLQGKLTSNDKPSGNDIPRLPGKLVMSAKLEDWPKAGTAHALSEFSRKVQPIILNGCGTGACHGKKDGSREYVLSRGLGNAEPNAWNTRTNLEHTLALLDKEKPDESLLLRRALDGHGEMVKDPLGKVDSSTFLAVRDWIYFLAEKQPVVKESAIAQQPLLHAPETGAGGFASSYPNNTRQVSTRGEDGSGFGSVQSPAASNSPSGFANESRQLQPETGMPLEIMNRDQASTPPMFPPSDSVTSPSSRGTTAPPQRLGNTGNSSLPHIPGLSGQAARQMNPNAPASKDLGPFEPPRTSLQPNQSLLHGAERRESTGELTQSQKDLLKQFIEQQQGRAARNTTAPPATLPNRPINPNNQ